MNLHLDRYFPRCAMGASQIPIWCLTPWEGHYTHRFFDTSAVSPSGRYVAVLKIPFEDRLPSAGDVASVFLIDLETGAGRTVADTRGWEHQLGANINWGGSDHELFFNDVDIASWAPFAWKLDPLSGEKQRMEGTVYHASPNGRWLISANLITMRKTQRGYGVCIPDSELPSPRIGPSGDEGFWMTHTRTGQRHLLVSLRTIADRLKAELSKTDVDVERSEIFGFHAKFNPQGDTLMLSLRWFSTDEASGWDVFRTNYAAVRFSWITLSFDPESGEADFATLRCATGPDVWMNPGHHATWFPDGVHISQNLAIRGAEDGLRFVQVAKGGSALGIIPGTEKLAGSGHPTLHADGYHILTDAYTNEPVAYGDGTVPLRWINLRTGEETHVARINACNPASVTHSSLRCDPHPAWDRTGRYIVFNAMDEGVRRVYLADMAGVLNA